MNGAETLSRRRFLFMMGGAIGSAAVMGTARFSLGGERPKKMIIDAYNHIYPKAYLERWANLKTVPSDSFVPPFKISGNLDKPWGHFSESEARIEHMDKFGVDMQLLTLALPAYDIVSAKEGGDLAQIANDGVAEVVARHPKRFQGISTLPMRTPDVALRELDRTIGTLGFKAIQIFGNVDGKPVDLPEYFPVYQRAAQLNIPILVHPRDWKTYDWVDEYSLKLLFGWPFDTTLAMSRFVYGGILEKLPNLKIMTHHAGAMVSFFGERIRAIDPLIRDREGKRPLPTGAVEYFKKFYGDTAVFGSTPALETARSFFGVEHLVFGTDYPFGPDLGIDAIRGSIQAVEGMNISDQEKDLIFSGNAKRIFKLT